MANTKKNLLIIGALSGSSGIGGVTVFVQRLLQCLDREKYPYDFVDYKVSLKSVFHKILTHSHIHLNVSNPYLIFLFTLFAKLFGKHLMFTLHGNYTRFKGMRAWCLKQAVKCSDRPIAINENSYKIMLTLNSQTVHIPAFVPPMTEEPLDKQIVDLLETLHNRGKRIFSTNASTYAVDKEGEETYGIKFLCEFFTHREKDVLLISDPSGKNKQRYSQQFPEVIFIDTPHNYPELLKHVEIFIRNTSTDGDAISVKEALYLGIPALCTNAVDRPAGVTLFHYNNAESLEQAITEARIAPAANTEMSNGADKMLALYRSL